MYLMNTYDFRLDVESKLPEELGLVFLHCRAEEKSAALVCVLRHILSLPDKLRQQTIVFAATKHHVEFLNLASLAYCTNKLEMS